VLTNKHEHMSTFTLYALMEMCLLSTHERIHSFKSLYSALSR